MPVTLAVADSMQKPRCHRQYLQHVGVTQCHAWARPSTANVQERKPDSHHHLVMSRKPNAHPMTEKTPRQVTRGAAHACQAARNLRSLYCTTLNPRVSIGGYPALQHKAVQRLTNHCELCHSVLPDVTCPGSACASAIPDHCSLHVPEDLSISRRVTHPHPSEGDLSGRGSPLLSSERATEAALRMISSPHVLSAFWVS